MNQTLFLFILDASEEFLAKPRDGLGLVEWHLVVDLATGKMTGLRHGLFGLEQLVL